MVDLLYRISHQDQYQLFLVSWLPIHCIHCIHLYSLLDQYYLLNHDQVACLPSEYTVYIACRLLMGRRRSITAMEWAKKHRDRRDRRGGLGAGRLQC